MSSCHWQMENPLIQPALSLLRYTASGSQSSQTGARPPSSCKPSAPFSFVSPPIVPALPPGGGPLAPFEAVLLQAGYYHWHAVSTFGSTKDPDDLNHEHSLRVWRIPTLVSLQQPRRVVNLARTDVRARSTNNNFPSSEIGIPPVTCAQLEVNNSFPHRQHDVDATHELLLIPAQGLHLGDRSLTSLFNVHTPNMTTTIVSAPGTPPDLAGDRSSKASSYSSTFSSPDGLDSDTTNFEEIGLEDDKEPTPRICTHTHQISMQSLGSQQDLIQSKEPELRGPKPSLPQLKTQPKTLGWRNDPARSPIDLPSLGMKKRGFTSQESLYPLNSARTRSSSPANRRVVTSIPNASLSAGGLRPGSHASSSLGLPARRASWQPHRKTVKELEAEYHDSDDDLPDDASLWNVPVSPFPSGTRSHRSSFRGSPDRDQVAHSPRPIPLAHAKTAPDTPPRTTLHSQTLPKHRGVAARARSLNPSRSNPSSPRGLGHMPPGRTKSWNFAMADLSEEARIISEALAYHAESMAQEAYGSPQGGSSRESLETPVEHVSRKKSPIQLPPIQKSTLDFMPISKEKEAVLSRTRPPWLPPKDPKEERRHLKEYQRMMAASLGAEKKQRTKVQAQQCAKDDTRESLKRIWHYYVAESTDVATIDQRVNSLCWRGITPSLRGQVWQKALGNPLALTRQSYEKALERAKEIKARPRDQLDQDDKSMERWFVDIERDAETAFPELHLFQRDGPLWRDLIDLCEAYACYRSDVGYIYGIQLIAALLLLQSPTPADAFILLATLLNRPLPVAFQTNDTVATGRTYKSAISTLKIKFPRLHEYLFDSMDQGGLGFTAEEVFEPMLRTVFSNGLDVDRLCRVWDVWVFEGDRTLVRAAVAILGCLQSQIFDVRGNHDLKKRNVQEMLGWGPFNRLPQSGHWNLQALGSEDKFMDEVQLAGMLDYTGR
ncbi:TBC domain-containing protein C23D3.03c [Exophiala dermatitidis]|uniref:Rab-GAP TBC domain-containing protein n=1 Tax=Exophiala dermatitidis (strain ATCC 34100 / CBS 525.76 / NIH/UT8656) TaxID=858893 RepID=H6BLA6_EXODN|nr:uncharacterized protein HMPREF1120_00077 [Exophiala dermatitidis NIH/UT8656]EHY51853.1 hypothetical protein HMPREF1120_00077 [Exophiala dermatitidis NIH/UT8656]